MAARHRLPASIVDMIVYEKLRSVRLASEAEALASSLRCNMQSPTSRAIATHVRENLRS